MWCVYVHKKSNLLWISSCCFFFTPHSWSNLALQWNQMDSKMAVISSLEKSKPFFRFWLLACDRSTLEQAFAESYPTPSCSDLAGRCPLADGLHRYAFACWLRTINCFEKQGKCKEGLICLYVLISHWVPVPERLRNTLFWNGIICLWSALLCACCI